MNRLASFIFLGIMIVILVVGMVFLSYLLILGAIIGVVLYFAAWIKEQFFNKKSSQYPVKRKKSNRTIDHDDL